MAARKAGRVPVTGIETMEHDMNATGAAGVRKIRPLLGRLCAVVGLGLAATGAGAGEGEAQTGHGSYELVHLGGPVDGHEAIDGLAVHDGDILLGSGEISTGPGPCRGAVRQAVPGRAAATLSRLSARWSGPIGLTYGLVEWSRTKSTELDYPMKW